MLSKPGKGYGLAKSVKKADGRMLFSCAISKEKDAIGKRRGKSKIYQLIKKHLFKFN